MQRDCTTCEPLTPALCQKRCVVKPVKIRLMSDSDLDSVAILFDLYRQFYNQPTDIGLANKFINLRQKNGESLIIVAESEENKIVGFCQLYPSFCSVVAARIYVLYDLYVLPMHRRFGVGRQLLVAAESQANLENVHHLDLTTAKSNYKSQALYESLGWEKDNIFISYSKNTCT